MIRRRRVGVPSRDLVQSEAFARMVQELDPTWGTSFVDATHIRDANNALVTSAALNLIDVEVV